MGFDVLYEQIEWEAKRVAAAFGVKEWTRQERRHFPDEDWIFSTRDEAKATLWYSYEETTCGFWAQSGHLKVIDVERARSTTAKYIFLKKKMPTGDVLPHLAFTKKWRVAFTVSVLKMKAYGKHWGALSPPTKSLNYAFRCPASSDLRSGSMEQTKVKHVYPAKQRAYFLYKSTTETTTAMSATNTNQRAMGASIW